ncbi:DUF998 domain-containing protein [Micromonospora endolithica]|uniref:DUF998 domain-containing protein n=1 Tax=Micromonospora endolithica TaxID=230091 RepID=A0A3A9ZLV5_9ACTN|nr:DUF998 domain-containing protein [Micromonospora endolithica]RKN49291.1 DUF998 domain-containing protein [Micromonospora endolithica]TWJ23472.1 uncharacterized protein DUF998 [Micromonospora endolithica]
MADRRGGAPTATTPRGGPTAPRAAVASAAAGSTLAGAVAVAVAVVAGPGPGLTGYVSEAGVTDSPYAAAYRLGVFALAAGVLLLAAALPPAARVAATLLAAGSVFALVSGAVACSEGCPLPPYEQATTADLVHGGASIAAVAAIVLAMVALVLLPGAPTALRRVAAVGAGVALPLSGVTALVLVLVGRGGLIAGLERLLLLTCVLWGVATATTVALGGGKEGPLVNASGRGRVPS